MSHYAILNLDSDSLIRDIRGEVVTWPTWDAAFDRAFALIQNFNIVAV